MAKVSLEINGRKYALGCDDGDEERLASLGSALDSRVRALADQHGQIGDLKLMVMAGLTMTDEIAEMQAGVDAQAEAVTKEIRADADLARRSAAQSEMDAANALSDAAKRIEKLAAKLAGS